MAPGHVNPIKQKVNTKFIAFESRTLFIIAKYFAVDPILHDIYRDHYFRRFGENLDLCPTTIIEHCKALKVDLNRLLYHYGSIHLTKEDYIRALDKIIEELESRS